MTQWSAQIAGLYTGQERMEGCRSELHSIRDELRRIDNKIRRQCPSLANSSVRARADSLEICAGDCADLGTTLGRIADRCRDVENSLSGYRDSGAQPPDGSDGTNRSGVNASIANLIDLISPVVSPSWLGILTFGTHNNTVNDPVDVSWSNFIKWEKTDSESNISVGGSVSAEYSLYENSYVLGESGEWGNLSLNLLNGGVSAGASAGIHQYDKDGNKVFSPNVNAEIGASISAVEAHWENQLLGDEMLGINADADVTLLGADANANATVQILDKDGNLNPDFGVSAKAEAVLIEAGGSIGANILGGEAAVTGSVKVGVGANAEAQYKDGVLKCEIGASVGIGIDIGFEIDIGGMVNTVMDQATSAINGISSLFSW